MPFIQKRVHRVCAILVILSSVIGGLSRASAQAIGQENSWAPMSSAAKVAYDDFSRSLYKFRGEAFPFSAFMADIRGYEKELIAVVAINSDKERSNYLAMRRRMKDFTMTMTEDRGDRSIAARYGVNGYPHLVMVDKEGLVAFTQQGYSKESLPKIVEEINLLLEE